MFLACKDCGITWRGIKHDLSKLSRIEFTSSARHFQGDRSPIDAEKEANGYSLAWQHHKGCNSHHIQYWVDWKDGEQVALKMPYDDMVELICDWIGAGKAYNSTEWTCSEPFDYWIKNKDRVLLHPDTHEFIEDVLWHIREKGWKVCAAVLKSKLLPY